MLSNCCPLLSESLPSRDTFKVFNPYRHRFKGFCPYNFTDGNLIGLFGIIYSNVKNLTKWFENMLKKLSELQYNNYEIITVGLIKKIYLVERIEIQKKRKKIVSQKIIESHARMPNEDFAKFTSLKVALTFYY